MNINLCIKKERVAGVTIEKCPLSVIINLVSSIKCREM